MEAASPTRELELSALEAEKRPMAAAEEEEEEEEEEGGPPPAAAAVVVPLQAPDPLPPSPPGEKNGLVKIPPDEELGGLVGGGGGETAAGAGGAGGGGGGGGGGKFTGLGKEELLRAAGAPPWAKARTFLLLLFWLGWLGMLGAAAAIVARAPRCQPLPPRAWWQQGGLYRAPPKPFAGDLKGVAARLEHVAGLQARGLVLGPLHPQPAGGGDPRAPPLEQLDPQLGTPEDLEQLLQAAKKRGLQVIVDLTPNYSGGEAWGGAEVTEDPGFQETVKRALKTWLGRGVAGIFLDAIEELKPSLVAEWRNLTEQNGPDGVPRVLLGGTRLRDPPALLELLNVSARGGGGAGGGPLPLLGRFLEALGPAPPGPAIAPRLLDFLRPGVPLAWSVGSPWQHLAGLSPPHAPQRLLLLWALPGTPVLSYGDEVGLAEPPGEPPAPQLTPMPWDLIEGLQEGDNSTEAHLLDLCRQLGRLRTRERSLALGEAEAIAAEPAAAFLRFWDQSERFLVLLNPGGEPLPRLTLRDPRLPPRATLRLSTHRPLPPDPHLDLGDLQLLPYEGLLLSFPYTP